MDYKPGPQEPTLCWGCKNTNRFKCPWFNPADPQPVPGWVAEPRTMYRGEQSYLVRECPNFTPGRSEAKPNPLSIPGVRYRRDTGKWYATIHWRNRQYYLGRFDNQQDASVARRKAEAAVARGEEPQRAEAGDVFGVFHRKWGKWEARIYYRGKTRYLGSFDTKQEAAAARRAAEKAIARGENPLKNT